jgi:hypothetical protein
VCQVIQDHKDIAVGTETAVAGTGDASGFCPVFYEEDEFADTGVESRVGCQETGVVQG